MRLSRFLAGTILITGLALIYVRQQVELVKLGYRIEMQQNSFAEVLDQNDSLRYNVVALKSPQNLRRQFLLAGLEELPFMEGRQVVRLARAQTAGKPPPAEGLQEPLAILFLQSLNKAFVSYLFGPEAEANTDNLTSTTIPLPRD